MSTISIGIPERFTVSDRATAAVTSALTRLTQLARAAWCRLNGGHYKVLYTRPQMLALRCVACGHTSPGWDVGAPRLGRTLAGDPNRLRAHRVEAA